jgi:serine/threonine protein kinase
LTKGVPKPEFGNEAGFVRPDEARRHGPGSRGLPAVGWPSRGTALGQPRQQLELFIPICQAIQHAHQKGIIHRDLKPSNVLVTLYDGRPVPKVIDFGVAKASGSSQPS